MQCIVARAAELDPAELTQAAGDYSLLLSLTPENAHMIDYVKLAARMTALASTKDIGLTEFPLRARPAVGSLRRQLSTLSEAAAARAAREAASSSSSSSSSK